MSTSTESFLLQLEADAIAANEAEGSFRKRMVDELAHLERARAFAFRRLNLMRDIANAIASTDTEEEAVARGAMVVRRELGWDHDTETRKETLAHLEPAIRTVFEGRPEADGNAEPDLSAALAEFEDWYEAAYGKPFWVLFDQEIPQLPLVEL